MKKSLEIFLAASLLLVALLSINYEVENVAFNVVKTIFVISIVIFVPGYLLVDLLFGKSLEFEELMVMAIGISIALVILSGLAVSFSGLPIHTNTVLNLVWIIAFVLTLIGLFKREIKQTKRRQTKRRATLQRVASEHRQNCLFYMNLILLLVVVASMICISINYPSPEEFVELRWALSKVEVNDVNSADLNCLGNCSLSGTNKIGKAKLGGEEYKALLVDLNFPKKYDSICVDTNRNGIYCEGGEGPIWMSDSFLIGDYAYSYIILESGDIAGDIEGDNVGDIVIFNFPKRLDRSNFTVSYVVKSHYKKIMDYDLFLTINQTVFSQRRLTLRPDQELVIEEKLVLPEVGVHKVEATAFPITDYASQEKASISFFVTRFTYS